MCGPSYAGISIYMYQCFLIGLIFLVLHIGYDKLHHDLSIVQVNCMRLLSKSGQNFVSDQMFRRR